VSTAKIWETDGMGGISAIESINDDRKIDKSTSKRVRITRYIITNADGKIKTCTCNANTVNDGVCTSRIQRANIVYVIHVFMSKL